MRRRSECFVLWLLAAVFLIMHVYKGHGVSQQGNTVAFAHRTSSVVTIRLTGDLSKPGVYRFPEGSTMSDVIIMTQSCLPTDQDGGCLRYRKIVPGDIVTVYQAKSKHLEITLDSMNARERMLLGIPLNPDIMNGEDWDALPGIGPELANAIVMDRQNYGDFGSIDRLERVPGIGSKRIEALRRYF